MIDRIIAKIEVKWKSGLACSEKPVICPCDLVWYLSRLPTNLQDRIGLQAHLVRRFSSMSSKRSLEDLEGNEGVAAEEKEISF